MGLLNSEDIFCQFYPNSATKDWSLVSFLGVQKSFRAYFLVCFLFVQNFVVFLAFWVQVLFTALRRLLFWDSLSLESPSLRGKDLLLLLDGLLFFLLVFGFLGFNWGFKFKFGYFCRRKACKFAIFWIFLSGDFKDSDLLDRQLSLNSISERGWLLSLLGVLDVSSRFIEFFEQTVWLQSGSQSRKLTLAGLTCSSKWSLLLGLTSFKICMIF